MVPSNVFFCELVEIFEDSSFTEHLYCFDQVWLLRNIQSHNVLDYKLSGNVVPLTALNWSQRGGFKICFYFLWFTDPMFLILFVSFYLIW